MLVKHITARPQATPADHATSTRMVRVLVADQTIPRGQRLTQDALRWQEWPQDAVSADFVLDKLTASELLGRMARTELGEGEPITLAKLVSTKAGSPLTALLPKTSRAALVPIPGHMITNNLVTPGDHLDIVLAQGRNRAAAGQTATILRNVTVLAVHAATAPASRSRGQGGSFATVELAPRQADLLAQAQTSGRVSIILHGKGEELREATGQLHMRRVDQTPDVVRLLKFGMPSRTLSIE